MADRDEIIAFCDELLEIERFEDYAPNGLQVPGVREVERVVSGVSAHRELLERAVGADAQLLIAHHGLLRDGEPLALSEQRAERLRIALGAGLSVAGYHLPLDAHPEIGNNVLVCRGLGFEPIGRQFGEVKGTAIGIVGEGPGVSAGELTAKVAELTGRQPLVFDCGPEIVRRIGVITGAGASQLQEAIGLGLDAFLTGEPSEHVMAEAREGSIHLIAAGHYATETFGIRRLGALIAERFGVEHSFVEIPNPV